jgi:hypothetical protein
MNNPTATKISATRTEAMRTRVRADALLREGLPSRTPGSAATSKSYNERPQEIRRLSS